MNLAAVTINAFAVICLLVSAFKDRQKTREALKSALRAGAGLAPTLLAILVLIALMMGFVTPEAIAGVLGEGSGPIGFLVAGFVGSVMHIPSLVAFPLGASLARGGASLSIVAVFITTLTMVGFVTLPVEIRVLGKRFALWRNGLSLFAAVLVGVLVGAVL